MLASVDFQSQLFLMNVAFFVALISCYHLSGQCRCCQKHQQRENKIGFYGLAVFKNPLTVWHDCVAEFGLGKICKIYFSIT